MSYLCTNTVSCPTCGTGCSYNCEMRPGGNLGDCVCEESTPGNGACAGREVVPALLIDDTPRTKGNTTSTGTGRPSGVAVNEGYSNFVPIPLPPPPAMVTCQMCQPAQAYIPAQPGIPYYPPYGNSPGQAAQAYIPAQPYIPAYTVTNQFMTPNGSCPPNWLQMPNNGGPTNPCTPIPPPPPTTLYGPNNYPSLIGLNATFVNNMEAGYQRGGCSFLYNRHSAIQARLNGMIAAGTNPGWQERLENKIYYIDLLITQYCIMY